MARTRFIVVILAIIAAVGLGAAIGSMAGGSKQPIAKWTPPAGTPDAQSTSTPGSGIVIPTLIATIGSFATPGPATATPQPTFVILATPSTDATPTADATPAATPQVSAPVTTTAVASPKAEASPQASPQVATPSPAATATATVAVTIPTTTIGSLNQLTPTAP